MLVWQSRHRLLDPWAADALTRPFCAAAPGGCQQCAGSKVVEGVAPTTQGMTVPLSSTRMRSRYPVTTTIIDKAATRPFTAPSGSIADPLANEATWVAWELTGRLARPLTEAGRARITAGFDGLVETAWRPGRSVVISELGWHPDARSVAVRLAVGVLGDHGSTRADAGTLAAAVLGIVDAPPFVARPVDPRVVVPRSAPPDGWHAAHIRQRHWTCGDDADVIDVVSRFAPTIEPWASVAEVCEGHAAPVRVRATVMATELSPGDRLELADGLDRAARLRLRNPDRPEVAFDAERATATLLDLRASFSTPLFSSELLVTSPAELPETFLRAIATAFTSETDVLRRQGHVVVASNRLILGGFAIERDPAGWADAVAVGLPLRGGTGPRGLRDLVTLTESPIGWPVPDGRPLAGIPTSLPSRRVATPIAQSPATTLGRDAAGTPVGLAVARRPRHVAVLGSWGTGKSTAMYTMALDDLAAGRPFLWLDPHGTTADMLTGWARHHERNPVVIDAGDGASDRLRVVPRLTARGDRDRAEAAIRRLGDAIVSSLPQADWAGPRFLATFHALAEVVAARGAELVDAAVWAGDPSRLDALLDHPRMSSLARSTLRSVVRGTDGRDVLGWVTSKLHPLVSGAARRIVAPAGRGVDIGTALRAGRPVIANLAGLSTGEASFLGHLLLDQAVSTAMESPVIEPLVTCFVDEAPRFPVRGLSTIAAEGRKFNLSLVFAVQSLVQLPDGFADLAAAADTHIVFRSTPATAERLVSQIGVAPVELLHLPDLHAIAALRGDGPVGVQLAPFRPAPVPHVKRRPRRLKAPMSAATAR